MAHPFANIRYGFHCSDPLVFSKPMSALPQSLQSYALVLRDPLVGSFFSMLWVPHISSTITSKQGWDESDSMGSSVCRFLSTFRPTQMTTYCWNIWYAFYSDLNACSWVSCIRWRLFGTSDFLHLGPPVSHTSLFSRIIESIHSGFLISANNSYLINGFGNLVLLTQISWCVYLTLLVHQLYSVQQSGIFWCVLSRPVAYRKSASQLSRFLLK